MGYSLRAALLVALILLPLNIAAGMTVTVHMINDQTVTGKLVSANGDSITIDTGPTTQPASKPTALPATQPTKLAMSDVAQVVFREAPPKVRPASTDEAPVVKPNESKGFFGNLFALFSSGETPPADAPVAPPADKPHPATTRPSDHGWQIRLADGESIHARVTQWAGPTLKVTLDAPLGQEAELPASEIAQIWCGSEDAIRKAEAMHRENGSEDIAFVEKEQDVIPVNGHALGIDDNMLKFRYGESDRKIAIGRLVGIIFATTTPQGDTGHFHQTISLDTGDRISGEWLGLDKESLNLKPSWSPALRIPSGSIYTVDFVNGRQIYLSDLKPAKVEQTPFFGRVIPYRLDSSLDGGPLKAGDTACPKGIAVHSRCVLSYETGPAFERFKCRLGFEQPAGRAGRVAVRVLGDGQILFDEPDFRGDKPAIDLDLDITGKHQLTLEVGFGKGQDVAGRVVWGNARLIRSK